MVTVVGEHPHHTRRWAILAVLAVAQLTVVLDSTIVNIALPSAQEDLHFSDADRQWVVTAYLLAFGSLLLIGGRLADVVGRKRIFLIGLTGFAVASAVGGAAPSFEVLVAARAVQGGFAALLAPAVLSLLTTTFVAPEERSKAFGIYGAVAGSGAAVGLLLGGLLTEYASWRWTMYVNLIFAFAGLAGGALLLRHIPSGTRSRLDWPGTICVSGGLFAIVYGFSHAVTAGWTNGVTIGFLVAAVALLVLFFVIEARTAFPLLPLSIILDRNRGGALLAMLTSNAGVFGVFLFLTYYLQGVRHFSAVQTGLAFLPMVLMLVLSSAGVTTRLTGRVSPRITLPVGMVCVASGIGLLTGLRVHSSFALVVLPATMLAGIGAGAIFSTGSSLATLGVQPDHAGVASATVSSVQQIGASVGTALLNTVAIAAAASYTASHTTFSDVGELSAVHSYSVAFQWSAAILLVGAAVVASILRSGVPIGLQRAEPAALPLRPVTTAPDS